ncbi:hypothetical protein BCIN_16g03760 [Botrytis cinerea B05.10]|uniref:Uncharacterized protein n=1 Tax=Botryotinia fuckeliana (strain B05.10) TaxID=332648 RepID=A0A384K758_BOTFB|nr:hypothetical protein BCIN_16g03760 [Botrytis cinerea B05.10]
MDQATYFFTLKAPQVALYLTRL